jgi:hypothetical protein
MTKFLKRLRDALDVLRGKKFVSKYPPKGVKRTRAKWDSVQEQQAREEMKILEEL